jgi:DNA mismatch repair protein MutS
VARAKSPAETPVMRQYLSFKEKHPDAVLFFRMGDFYEMFFGDAELAAKELGLTLTSRDKQKENGVPMAGVPYHAAEGYIAKLVRKGYRVAVCEQTGDPARSKGLVERSITEIVTPGTALNDALIPENANNYVAAILPSRDLVGLAAADVTTGEFLLEDVPLERFEQDTARLGVSEWVVAEPGAEAEAEAEASFPPGVIRPVHRPGWWFDEARGRRELTAHFGVQSLAGFDCDDLGPALGAGGALLDYLREVRGPELKHLVRLRRFGIRDYMVLDGVTRRNLELTAPLMGESRELTLLHTLDRTVTGLGARRLRAWLERPLVTREKIELRLDAVEELVDRAEEADLLGGTLRRFRDLERLLGKAACAKATPRDVRALGEGALATPELTERLGLFTAAIPAGWVERVPDLTALGERVTEALVDEPPLSAGEGGVFRPGFHAELDAIRERARGGKAWIARLQEKERKATGIGSLKVGFNKVFGYYLEVTAAHQAKVPEHYIRKQTLVNAERYVTPELKEEEEKILGAEERLRALELELFAALRDEVVAEAARIQVVAEAVGEADALLALTRAAREGRYVRPEIVEEPVLAFREGRHPVVERILPAGEFVPNDLGLDAAGRQIAVITGPNMAGKSTYLRQAGLLAIMAQMGSFVPAASARVGIVDRVFTRVGASDNIARGQSTFMVEMEETATILNAATGRSLVLLDEVGRGTSTYDGLSLAWAVTEHLHQRPHGRPRTLFATHYHELTALAEKLPRVVNLNVQVKEWNGKVIFMRKIVDGAADRSYGIHVAELAGLPPEVVARARSVLARLEEGRFARRGLEEAPPSSQLTLFEPIGNELVEELRDLEPERMTPIEALELLSAWKQRFGGGSR